MTALRSRDDAVVRAGYVAMDVATRYAIVPLAVASLVTGLLSSLVTTWGAGREAHRPGEQHDVEQEEPSVIDGEADSGRPRRSSAAEREQRASEHVRSAWPEERAERVIRCQAWGVLVN